MDETGSRFRKERSEDGEQGEAEEKVDRFAAALPPCCSRRLFADIVVEQVAAFERASGGRAVQRDPHQLRERERRGADDPIDKDGTATALRPFESVSVPWLRRSNPPSDSSNPRDVFVDRAGEGDD